MNPYLKNLSKIEFVVTDACTGRCKHCSEGEHKESGERIDPDVAARVVKRVAERYGIKTVMTFGGEPLLFPDAVEAVMRAATDCGIPVRQVITNGYFSKDDKKISDVARGLSECGVNDLLLSVDAFHQESIPLEAVRAFAEELKECGVPIRLSPAWLVSEQDENPYNIRTRSILEALADLELEIGQGNVVFPEGNALKHLSEYFVDGAPENPYREDPCRVKCLSFEPDGAVLGENIREKSIMKIIEDYSPI